MYRKAVPDIPRFKVGYIPQTLSAKIQRQVLRKAWLPRGTYRIKVQSYRILQAYRNRLDELAPCLTLLRQHPDFLSQMRNCMPSHIVPVPGHRTVCCNKRLICPWCHTRWVREIWELFERVMWLDEGPEPSPYSLIWTEPDRSIVCPDWPLQNAIKTYKSQMKTPPISDVVGHVAWVQVVPWHASPQFYRVSRFFLGLTENHEPLTTKLCRPTRPVAARVFCRFFQYPWRMVRSLPWLVSNVLDAQAGHRLFNRYGILRSTPDAHPEPSVPLCCPPRD